MLARVRTESDRCGWFRGTVVCMTMAFKGADLAETFAANPSVLVVCKRNICAGARVKKLQNLGSGNIVLRTINLYADATGGPPVTVTVCESLS